jgi:hypothetical protein
MHLYNVREHDCNTRLVGKFLEGEGEKIDRLVELFMKYRLRLRNAERELESEREKYNPYDPEWEGIDWEDFVLSTRLDAGLYALQLTSIIFAFAIVHNEQCAIWGLRKLHQEGIAVQEVRSALAEYIQTMDSDDETVAERKMLLTSWSAAAAQLSA